MRLNHLSDWMIVRDDHRGSTPSVQILVCLREDRTLHVFMMILSLIFSYRFEFENVNNGI